MRVSSIGGSDDAQTRGKLAARVPRDSSRVRGAPGGAPAAGYRKDAAKGMEAPHFVLLVEDNIADVFLIQRAIERYGLSVNLSVMEDGEQALHFLDALQDNPDTPCPEIVLLDLNLPRRSGADVLQALRSKDRCHDVPVIVLTSSDSQEDRDRAIQFGANAYFRKPSAYREFLQIGQIMKDHIEHPGAA